MGDSRHPMGLSSLAALWFLVSIGADAPRASADSGAVGTRSWSPSEENVCVRLGGELFFRTELFFGLSRADGPDITEEEFQQFVDSAVTPRFPDGLTLTSGKGQFKSSTGEIIQEGSKVLILLYKFSKESNRAVERVRNEYKEQFAQESVLRVDERSCVSF
jgi:hypothetical protein